MNLNAACALVLSVFIITVGVSVSFSNYTDTKMPPVAPEIARLLANDKLSAEDAKYIACVVSVTKGNSKTNASHADLVVQACNHLLSNTPTQDN